MDKIEAFILRLDKIGIKVKLTSNAPWIYLTEINGKRVTETFHGEHGFTIAFTPIRPDQELQFTDIGKIFRLIRKYCVERLSNEVQLCSWCGKKPRYGTETTCVDCTDDID